MDKLKDPPAEILKTVQIKPIEQECLDRVFNYLKNKDTKKLPEHADKIGILDIANTLLYLGLRPTKN
jgi:hypothetical protein